MTDLQPPRPTVVSGDQALQSEVLEDLAAAVNYRQWLASLALPWLGDDPIEAGSGRGDYAAEWAHAGLRVTASEADPGRLAELERRFADDEHVSVRELVVPIRERAEHSAVVTYNVLEHLADDVEALGGLAKLVRPGGHVLALVPAFEIAMSRFDREIGHYRRYRRDGLRRTAEAAGLNVVDCHYVNAVGLVAWIALVRLLRRRPRAGPGLRVYDRLIPGVRGIERVWRPPFGQSVFLVARVPEDPAPG